MEKFQLIPTSPDLFGIECAKGFSFADTLRRASQLERAGDFDKACATRFEAVSLLADSFGDEEEPELDWNDTEARAAIECTAASAVDLFLAGEWELSAATAELALTLDSEDHLALGDMECFHDLELDLDERSDYKAVMNIWAALIENRKGDLGKAVANLRTRHPELYAEFCAESHPITPTYAADLESERPSRATRARRLWLATEVLWTNFPEVINSIKG